MTWIHNSNMVCMTATEKCSSIYCSSVYLPDGAHLTALPHPLSDNGINAVLGSLLFASPPCSQLSVHATLFPSSHQCDGSLQWGMTVCFIDVQQSVNATYGVLRACALCLQCNYCTISPSGPLRFFIKASFRLVLDMLLGYWCWHSLLLAAYQLQSFL